MALKQKLAISTPITILLLIFVGLTSGPELLLGLLFIAVCVQGLFWKFAQWT